jgi:antitoxin component YwqK of YwqJK toxin-antitoxin module
MKEVILILVSYFILVTKLSSCQRRENYIEYWKDSTGNKTKLIRVNSSIRANKLDGYTLVYHENGKLFSKAYYENDRLRKVICVLDSSGNKLKYGYLNENGDGYLIQYSSLSGTKLYSGYIKNGRKSGWWRTFDSNGKTRDSIHFNDGYRKDLPNIKSFMY